MAADVEPGIRRCSRLLAAAFALFAMLLALPVSALAAGSDDAGTEADAYQTAMRRYEMIPPAGVRTASPRPFIPVSQLYLWTWVSADARVQRMKYGLFRLSERHCLHHFCVDISCHAGKWPEFLCSDGRSRDMSAPDARTMIFGGVTYRRIGGVDPPVGER